MVTSWVLTFSARPGRATQGAKAEAKRSAGTRRVMVPCWRRCAARGLASARSRRASRPRRHLRCPSEKRATSTVIWPARMSLGRHTRRPRELGRFGRAGNADRRAPSSVASRRSVAGAGGVAPGRLPASSRGPASGSAPRCDEDYAARSTPMPRPRPKRCDIPPPCRLQPLAAVRAAVARYPPPARAPPQALAQPCWHRRGPERLMSTTTPCCWRGNGPLLDLALVPKADGGVAACSTRPRCPRGRRMDGSDELHLQLEVGAANPFRNTSGRSGPRAGRRSSKASCRKFTTAVVRDAAASRSPNRTRMVV